MQFKGKKVSYYFKNYAKLEKNHDLHALYMYKNTQSKGKEPFLLAGGRFFPRRRSFSEKDIERTATPGKIVGSLHNILIEITSKYGYSEEKGVAHCCVGAKCSSPLVLRCDIALIL